MESWHSNGYSDAQEFETGRIRELKNERLNIQQKTFTKWVNSFLQKAGYQIEDIFTDLCDGRMLIRLLEIISGERLGRPNPGKLRVHKIENVNKSLAFLHTKVRLESIGAEDIVDGNQRLILGLIWTIILRFQIQEIEIEVTEDDESSEKRSARDALLLWCQRRLRNYPNVAIRDFSTSWRSGLGFCGLLHSQNPGSFDYNKLDPHDHINNLNKAFSIAETQYGITKLLDAEDVDVPKPDDKSILTYISSYYHTFSRLSKENKGAKRIFNIISKIKGVDDEQDRFELDAEELIGWIKKKTLEMKDRNFPNDVDGLRNVLKSLNRYFTTEKPAKCRRKVDIEAKYFFIASSANVMQKSSIPSNTKKLQEIESLWEDLEKEENRKKAATSAELVRLEKLEHTASNFRRKAAIRENYLNEMIAILSDPRYGTNLSQVSASVKKHKAILADIMSREERLVSLNEMVEFLEKENFHGKAEITLQYNEIMSKWKNLTDMMSVKGDMLSRYEEMSLLLSECDAAEEAIIKFKEAIRKLEKKEDVRSAMEDIQKLAMLEGELNILVDTVDKLMTKVKACKKKSPDEQHFTDVLDDKLKIIQNILDEARTFTQKKKQNLENLLMLEKIVYDLEETHLWIYEKMQVANIVMPNLNQAAINREKEKQKMLENEIGTWRTKLNSLRSSVQNVPTSSKVHSTDLASKLSTIESDWAQLLEVSDKRSKEIDIILKLFTLNVEVQDSKSWLKSVNTILPSFDNFTDRSSCLSLLGRLRELQKQLMLSQSELVTQQNKTNEFLEEMRKSGALKHNGEVKERIVPQVKALYEYKGKDIHVLKGEVMFLIAKNNNDWWSVRKFDGNAGFVPRNYVTEVKPKSILVQVVDQDESPSQRVARNLELEKTARKNLENLAHLSNLLQQKESVMNEHSKLLDYRDKCKSALGWLQEQKNVLKSTKETITMVRKIEKYAEDVSALSVDCIALCKSLPSEKKAIKKNYLDVEKEYNSLVLDLQQHYEEENRNMQVDSMLKDCEETLSWLQEKKKELDQIYQSVLQSHPENMLRRLELFQHELEPLSEKVSRVTYKLKQTKDYETKVFELQSEFQDLESNLEDCKKNMSNAIKMKKFEKDCNSYYVWATSCTDILRDEYLTMNLPDAEKQLNKIKTEVEEQEDVYSELSLKCENDPVIYNNVDLMGKIRQAREELLNSVQAAEQDLAVQRQLEKNKKEQQTLKIELSQLDTIMSRDDGVRETEFNIDGRMQTAQRKMEQLMAPVNGSLEDEPDSSIFSKDEIRRLWTDLTNKYRSWTNKAEHQNAYDEFGLPAQEMEAFLEQKMSWARDCSFKGKANLLHKMTQQKRIENEIRVNAGQLRYLNIVGNKLVKNNNDFAHEVTETLTNINNKWDELLDLIEKKNEYLEHSFSKIQHEATLQGITSDISELELSIHPIETLSLSECREKSRQYSQKRDESNLCSKKLADLNAESAHLIDVDEEWGNNFLEKVNKQNHILDDINANIDENLKACDRNADLISYLLQLDSELNWMKEKQNAISLLTQPQTLVKASTPNQMKTLAEEINEHLPKIQAKLDDDSALDLASQKGTLHRKLTSKMKEIRQNLESLRDMNQDFKHKKDFMERFGNTLKDLLALDTWIDEKKVQLSSENYGSDLASVGDLVKKQKLLDIEIDCYAGIAKETMAQTKMLSKSPEASNVNQDLIPHAERLLSTLDHLRELSRNRQAILSCIHQYYECMQELIHFDQWMEDKFSVVDKLTNACNKNDPSSIQNVLRKASELEQKMEQGETNFEQCNDLYQQLCKSSDEVEIVSIDEAIDFYSTVEKKWNSLKTNFRDFHQEISKILEKSLVREDIKDFLKELNQRNTEFNLPWDWLKKPRTRLIKDLRDLDQEMEVKKLQKQSLEDKVDTLRLNRTPEDIRDMEDLTDALTTTWQSFADASDGRRVNLEANLELSKFLVDCDDVLQWIHVTMATFPKYSDSPNIIDAKNCRRELDSVKIEIESKEQVFKDLLQQSENLKQQVNPSYLPVIQDKLKKAMDSRQLIHMTWQKSKVELDQAIDHQYFTRETRQTRALLGDTEARMNGFKEKLVSLEDGEAKKELSILEKNLKNLHTKVAHVDDQGKRLVSQHHTQSQSIQGEVKALKAALDNVDASFACRVKDLELHERARKVSSASSERKQWMLEKIAPLRESLQKHDEEPVKKQLAILRRFNAIESDVKKVESDIQDLIQEGREVSKLEIGNLYGVPDGVTELEKSWNDLRQVSLASSKKYQGLSELSSLEQELTMTENRITNGSFLCKSSDTGLDLEHCIDLERILQNERNELESSQKSLTKLTKKYEGSLIPHPQLQDRLVSACTELKSLSQSFDSYDKTLKRAKERHQILRDIDDLKCEVLGKASILQSISVEPGSNLPNRQRRVESILKSLHENQEKASNIRIPSDPDSEVNEKLLTLLDLITQAITEGEERLKELEKGQSLKDFVRDMVYSKDLLQSHCHSLTIVSNSISSDSISRGMSLIKDAEDKLQNVELSAIQQKMEDKYPQEDEAVASFSDLKRAHESLAETISSTRQLLEKEDTLYFLNCKASDLMHWIRQSEAKITPNEAGNFLSETRNLMMVLKNVENEFQNQWIIFKEFESKFEDHMASRGQDIDSGFKSIMGKMEEWKKNLIFAEKCYLLMNSLERMKAVLDEKWQLSIEGAFIEMDNWESKNQKYQSLKDTVDNLKPKVTELLAKSKEISVPSDCSALQNLTVELTQRADDLKKDWGQLHDQLELIERRLSEAKKASNITDQILVLEKRLSEIENFIKVESGSDAKTVGVRLNKMEKYLETNPNLLNSINTITKTIGEESEMEKAFLDVVTERQSLLTKQHSHIEKLLRSQVEYLKNYLEYLKLNEDFGTQIMWISEKESQLDINNFDVSNLLQVESRLKRCKLIKEEVLAKLPGLDELIAKCVEIADENKDFSDKLGQMSEELSKRRSLLQTQMTDTMTVLENSLLSEHFILDCQEALALIDEKEMVLKQAIHADDHMLTSFFNRVTNFADEKNKEKDILDNLEKRRDEIMERKRQDAKNVHDAFNLLKMKQKSVQDLLHQTLEELELRIKYQKLCQESDELLQNITRQSIIASNENFGKNISEVSRLLDEFLEKQEENQIIQQNIDDFIHECQSMSEVANLGPDLKKRSLELHSLWEEVKELTEARKQALHGAKSVHAFDKSVDDMKDYLVEKTAVFSQLMFSQEEATLLMGEDTLTTHDINGTKEKVNGILDESNILASKYPDASIHIVDRTTDLTRVLEEFLGEYSRVKLWIKNELLLLDFEKEYRDWMAWVSEKMNLITLNDLPETYHEGVYLMEKHDEIFRDIESQKPKIIDFIGRCQEFQDKSRHKPKELHQMMANISERKDFLFECWTLRQELYSQHLDYLKWKSEINNIETWLTEKEDLLANPNLGESIEDVEELLKGHSELEELLGFENDRVDKILRLTKIESKMKMLKEKEENKRKQEHDRKQKEAQEAMKKRENMRATREKKRQDDRRRTQEIVLPPKSSQDAMLSGNAMSSTLTNIVMSGVLERKHEYEEGGKRAASRSWKNFFVILRTDRIEMYHSKESHEAKDPAVLNISTTGLRIEVPEYSKRSHSFRIVTGNKAEYLFSCQSKEEKFRWLQCLESTSILSSSASSVPVPMSSNSAVDNNGTMTSTTKPSHIKEKRSVFEKILNRKTKS